MFSKLVTTFNQYLIGQKFNPNHLHVILSLPLLCVSPRREGEGVSILGQRNTMTLHCGLQLNLTWNVALRTPAVLPSSLSLLLSYLKTYSP
jgi:hypothetical protein